MEQAIFVRDQDERTRRARHSLEGLSVGDAFGEQFFQGSAQSLSHIEERLLPSPPWPYTDDTEMTLSIVSQLSREGTIHQDRLAASFAAHYNPSRGYGPSMHSLLRALRAGSPWREAAPAQFSRQGSFGNGAAMRVAPIGAFFTEDLDTVVEQAIRSAVVTES